jgi:hypothetical protein
MYDVTIIGSGISGLFLAYSLSAAMPNLKILMIEKGRSFRERICSIDIGAASLCINCDICNRLFGFGGLGRSEGKFNYTFDFGGELHKKIGMKEAEHAMGMVDEILCSFDGEQVPIYDTENEMLASKLPNEKYRLLSAKVRHLGTSLSARIMQRFEDLLSSRIDIYHNETVAGVNVHDSHFSIQLQDAVIKTKKLVMATGQPDKEFLFNLERWFDIVPGETRLDLGIRVEMPNDYLANTLSDSFETKIQYQHKELMATTYCMNPRGRVIKRYQEGLVMADGQNYRQGVPTEYLNFTTFVPFYFSLPNEALDYARNVVSHINKGRGRIVCQRYEDFMKKIATDANACSHNTINLTVDCEAGNLWDEVPKSCIDGLLQILNALRHIEQSEIPNDTLLYGIDAKFYSPLIPTDIKFQSYIPNLYFIGDCSGVTSSLSQAAASGVYLANYISDEMASLIAKTPRRS